MIIALVDPRIVSGYVLLHPRPPADNLLEEPWSLLLDTEVDLYSIHYCWCFGLFLV